MGIKIVETEEEISSSKEVMSDILELQFSTVNAFVVGDPKSKTAKWVLIDTGLENSVEYILQSTEERFGKNNPPQAIILTHGHFDHVGSVITLVNHWDVPVYMHQLEIPYITGEKDYPVGDVSADNEAVVKMAPTPYHKNMDIGNSIKALPSDGSIPFMSGWKWIHTPGHTPGHISLFREKDRTLIVGDAFCTLKQKNIMFILSKSEQLNGYPKYVKTNYKDAEISVNHLKELNPIIAIPSHGNPMKGIELAQHLEILTHQKR